ncbi:MAG: hypothetical protein GY810_30390 [Aureispira sp.]|nr:hypothetical protein [Aureispira sp.]
MKYLLMFCLSCLFISCNDNSTQDASASTANTIVEIGSIEENDVVKEEQEDTTVVKLDVPETENWPYKAYKYAKIYGYNIGKPKDLPRKDGRMQMAIVNKEGVFNPNIKYTEGISIELAEKVQKHVEKMEGTRILSKCFFPRHAIVLFDVNDDVVARVEVCFTCEDVRVVPDVNIPDDEKSSPYIGENFKLNPTIKGAFKFFEKTFKQAGMPIFHSEKELVDWEKAQEK